MNRANFEIFEGDPESHVVLHVPHSSRVIPEAIREQLLLTDMELEAELDEMTDTSTDLLASKAAAGARLRPWIFQNSLSRLVIDPERFPDEREAMNAIGMGAVYVKTSVGKKLRDIDTERDLRLIERYFYPYAAALELLTQQVLTTHNRVTIIDVHSYRMREHPNGINKGAKRPPVCIGVDNFHTPQWLRELSIAAFSVLGEYVLNEPYVGTYVPLSFYESEPRVTSVMMENREDTILGEKLESAAGALSALIDGIHQG